MLHKVIGIIRRANKPNGPQAYYTNIQRDRPTSSPTYDEARKDFRRYEDIKHRTFGHLG